MDRRVQWPNKMKNQTNKGLYLPEVHRIQKTYTVERVSLSTRQTDTLKWDDATPLKRFSKRSPQSGVCTVDLMSGDLDEC